MLIDVKVAVEREEGYLYGESATILTWKWGQMPAQRKGSAQLPELELTQLTKKLLKGALEDVGFARMVVLGGRMLHCYSTGCQ